LARDLSGVLDTNRLDAAIRVVTGGILTISRGFFAGSYTIQAPKYGATEEDFLRMIEEADFSGAMDFSADDIRRNGIFESARDDGRYYVRIGPGYVMGERGTFILDLSQAKPKDLPPRLTVDVSRESVGP